MDCTRRIVIFSALSLSAALAGCATETPPASARSDAQAVVDGAVAAVQAMRASSDFAASGLLQRAKAVLIVPRSLKVAVVAGGEGGHAVLVGRTARGWSDPAFYTVGSGSLGPQIGVRNSTSVLLIMTDRALNTFLQNSNVTLGALGNVTVGQFSKTGSATIGGQDAVLWTDAQGLFIGGSVAAQGLAQDADYNRAYYGRNVPAIDVLANLVHNPAAAPLRAAL